MLLNLLGISVFKDSCQSVSESKLNSLLKSKGLNREQVCAPSSLRNLKYLTGTKLPTNGSHFLCLSKMHFRRPNHSVLPMKSISVARVLFARHLYRLDHHLCRSLRITLTNGKTFPLKGCFLSTWYLLEC